MHSQLLVVIYRLRCALFYPSLAMWRHLCALLVMGTLSYSGVSLSKASILQGLDLSRSINALMLSKSDIVALLSSQRPLLLTNPFEQRFQAEHWLDSLFEELQDTVVHYDNRITDSVSEANDHVDTFECTFAEYLDMFEENSDHEDAVYLMSETLLSPHKSLSDVFTLNRGLFESDLFRDFPSEIQPRQALIVSGKGARSFLHRDPFDWLGWNYLIAGRKLWVFLEPLSTYKDDLHEECRRLQAHETTPDAWAMEQFNLAAGSVSDIDLFRDTASLNKFKAAASTTTDSVKGDNPSHRPREYTVEHQLPSGVRVRVQCRWQLPGELVLIPAHHWHQVYSASAAIAVAGQHLHSLNLRDVLHHMLTQQRRACEVNGALSDSVAGVCFDGAAIGAEASRLARLVLVKEKSLSSVILHDIMKASTII